MIIASKSKKLSRARGILLACLIFATLGMVSSHKWVDGRVGGQSINPRLINKTNALGVVDTTITEANFPDVRVTLVNQSTRNINGYVLSLGTFSITTDFAFNGELFKPGETRVETISMGNVEAAAKQDANYTGEIMIAAVSFEGLTGEGEVRHLKELLDRHRGMMQQVSLLLPLLAEKQRDTSPVNLAELEQAASTLPSDVENVVLSPHYKEGQRWISDECVKMIRAGQAKEQRSSDQDRQSLNELRAHYEKILTGLKPNRANIP